MKVARLPFSIAVVLAGSISLCAQVSPDLEQGMKPYGSYYGGAIDQVSLTNGNLVLQAGLFAYSQRGGELAYPVMLRYNNKNFSYYQPACTWGTNLGATSCPLSPTIVFGPRSPGSTPVSYSSGVTVGFEGLPGRNVPQPLLVRHRDGVCFFTEKGKEAREEWFLLLPTSLEVAWRKE